MRSKQAGDTLIEVLLAVTIFSVVAVGVMTVMNKGTNTAQRALEITLVRQQIDSQADALRAIHQAYTTANDATTRAAWDAVAGPDSSSYIVTTTCPDADEIDGNSFALDPLTAQKLPGTWFKPMTADTAPPYAQLATENNILKSYGLWIEPKRINGGTANDAYEFAIKTCWFDVSNSRAPMQLHTIVRLYDPS